MTISQWWTATLTGLYAEGWFSWFQRIEVVEAHRTASLVIALFTSVLSFYLAIMWSRYVKRLRNSPSDMQDLVISLAYAKANLCFWSVSNVINIAMLGDYLPWITLPSRTLWLLVVIKQVRVIMRTEAHRPELSHSLASELDVDGRYVLVIENEMALGKIYVRWLREAGFNAELMPLGADALTFLGFEQPSLMIVDIGLPDMTGVELMVKARESGYRGPAVAISGTPFDWVKEEQLKPAGFVQEMTKTDISPDSFVAMVRRWTLASKKEAKSAAEGV